MDILAIKVINLHKTVKKCNLPLSNTSIQLNLVLNKETKI